MTTGDVKEGYRQQTGTLRGVRVRCRKRLPLAQQCARTAKSERHQVDADVAMRSECTFRPTGGAGGVEQRRIVFRFEFDGGRGVVRQLAIVPARTPKFLEGDTSVRQSVPGARDDARVEIEP